MDRQEQGRKWVYSRDADTAICVDIDNTVSDGRVFNYNRTGSSGADRFIRYNDEWCADLDKRYATDPFWLYVIMSLDAYHSLEGTL